MTRIGLEDLQGWIEDADLELVNKILAAVAGWPLRASCSEEFNNYKVVLRYQDLMQEDGEMWLSEARAWLHKLCADYQHRFWIIYGNLK